MKTKSLWSAVIASAALIAQAQAGTLHATHGGIHAGAGAHAAPAVHAPARTGGFSSMHSMPTRSFGGRMIYPGRRYSSFATHSPAVFRRPNMYSNRVRYTRSGPFTVATIRQPNQINRFPRSANYRDRTATSGWNQPNIRSQFRNGNNHLRSGWQRHVFAHRSRDWQHDWNRQSDHWWNGHHCCFINGTWVIFNVGFDPWWSYGYYPNDYYGYGSPSYGYALPYSEDYQPNYYDSDGYQGQMYFDQNNYPDQSQGYYDSTVYQSQVYDDPNSYSDQTQSNYSIAVAAQERLAREGYYHGESDGTFSPEMQKAVKRYQITNGLRATGYLDADTLAVMGLQKGNSY